MPAAADRLAETVRIEGTRVLATLVRIVGRLDIAEDSVQEACLAALRTWPMRGIPAEPRAWLTVAARHKALDLLRREQARVGKEREALMELEGLSSDPFHPVVDDRLRLFFVCCHPALAAEAQVALTLRTLCALSSAQIAAVMLSSETAVAKRLTRTRQKIASANIPYRVPADDELPQRLSAVAAVIHALYTSGHAPLGGSAVLDVDLCAEAQRLARLLVDLMPDESLPAALLALILLTEARRPARVDSAGDVVLLADQDRRRWDAQLIDEGLGLLESSLRRTGGIAGAYQLQAAIAAEHARAACYPDTDWAEIVRLYDLLLTVARTPAVQTSRAVAIAELYGAAAGLDALSGVALDPRGQAVRAELLARLGRYPEALAALEASFGSGSDVTSGTGTVLTDPERRFRERRRAEWRAGTAGSAPHCVETVTP